jgi:hypothetical protein
MDIHLVPGAQMFGDGTVYVPMVKLVGTWDGFTLGLTESPRPAKSSEATPFAPCNGTGTLSEPQAQAITTSLQLDTTLKTNGIQLLDAQVCGETVRVVLAVADGAAVDYLNNRYGHLEISGWLQPVVT